MEHKNFLFMSMSPVGDGISGGDRIFIELAKNFKKKGYPVTIVSWRDGVEMCKRNKLDEKIAEFKIINMGVWENSGFLLCYIARIVYGIIWSLLYNLKKDFPNTSSVVLYSASEFWMDAIPGFILKKRYPNIKWIATWFQTAPNPIKGFAEVKRENSYRFRAFLYWFAQLPVRPIFSHFADFVLVNNENERKVFNKLDKHGRVVVVLGAVNIDEIDEWRGKHKSKQKKYEAVFQGRFHAQKGVVELIEIWKRVIRVLPKARLVMIGDGPLMRDVKLRIKKLKLSKNIELIGYVFDGDLKYKTFSESKVVVHPALYDSGGMASSEAMAFDLPVVGFNLASYNSYYAKGMVKVPVGNLEEFADAIAELLTNSAKYKIFQKEASDLIHTNWSWDNRADEILKAVSV